MHRTVRMMATSQQGAEVPGTVHLYYEDTSLFTCEAKILLQEELEAKDGEKHISLILDRTVMHPQGGMSMQYQPLPPPVT